MMADGMQFNIQGLNGVVDKMRTLGPRLKKKGLRKAARAAMNIVRDAAKANAKAIDDPATKEKVFRNLITQESSKQSKREGGVVMRVGVRGNPCGRGHVAQHGDNPRYRDHGARQGTG